MDAPRCLGEQDGTLLVAGQRAVLNEEMSQQDRPSTFNLQPSTRPQQPGSLAGELPDFTLLELADRLLHRGVVLVGEATISVGGVDLIYLGLNVVLTAVENLKKPAPPR